MTTQDLVIQLVGFAGAFLIAFYFFRAQQKTDFNKILEQLRALAEKHDLGNTGHQGRLEAIDRSLSQIRVKMDGAERDLNRIKIATDVEATLNELRSIDALRSSYESLNLSINDLPDKIIRAFHAQQQQFEQKIESEIGRQMNGVTASIRQALTKEIATTISPGSDQRALVERLEQMIKNIMATLAKFQNELLRKELAKAGEQIAHQVRVETTKVLAGAKEVGNTINALPKLEQIKDN